MNITTIEFNDFRMKYYYNFISLRDSGLVNPRPTLPTPSYKRHYLGNNLKSLIKCNHAPPKFDMVKLLCNDTKSTTLVNTENHFIIPSHGMMINKDH